MEAATFKKKEVEAKFKFKMRQKGVSCCCCTLVSKFHIPFLTWRIHHHLLINRGRGFECWPPCIRCPSELHLARTTFSEHILLDLLSIYYSDSIYNQKVCPRPRLCHTETAHWVDLICKKVVLVTWYNYGNEWIFNIHWVSGRLMDLMPDNNYVVFTAQL